MALTKAHNRMIAGQYVNVRDFGATGDGSTDDTAAIQAAIDFIDTGSETETGGIVYFPRGTYMISSTIYVRNTHGSNLASVTLEGEGMQNTTIQCKSGFTGTTAMEVTDSTYCAFKEFHLFGGNPSNCDNGLEFVNGSEIYVERVFCQRFNQSGFLVRRCFMMTFLQCRGKASKTNFNFAYDYGNGTAGYNTSINCMNCYSLDTTAVGQGFWINDMSYSTFTACGSDGASRWGYRIGNCAGVAFNGCGAETSGRAGFYFEASAANDAALINGTRCSVNDCFVTQADQDGGGYGSVYSNQADTSFIDVVIKDFTETSPASGVSVAAGGVATNHRVEFQNEALVHGARGVGARFQPATVDRYEAVSVTAANTPIINLKSVFQATNFYSGVLHVIATNATYAQSLPTNLTAYVLLVTKSSSGSGVVEIAKNGLTTGGSGNHPSFTWSIDTTNNQLEASPIGSTSGTFYFYVTQLGGLDNE